MKSIMLIILVVTAIMTLQTKKMKNAVIYLGVFSIIIAFVYLLQGAPDVAIAEAVIGSTMTTILYIVALHKYKLYRIYINFDAIEINDSVYKKNNYNDLLKSIKTFCYKNDLDPMTIYTVDKINLKGMGKYHLNLEIVDYHIQLSYHRNDIKSEELFDYLSKKDEFSTIRKKIF